MQKFLSALIAGLFAISISAYAADTAAPAAPSKEVVKEKPAAPAKKAKKVHKKPHHKVAKKKVMKKKPEEAKKPVEHKAEPATPAGE